MTLPRRLLPSSSSPWRRVGLTLPVTPRRSFFACYISCLGSRNTVFKLDHAPVDRGWGASQGRLQIAHGKGSSASLLTSPSPRYPGVSAGQRTGPMLCVAAALAAAQETGCRFHRPLDDALAHFCSYRRLLSPALARADCVRAVAKVGGLPETRTPQQPHLNPWLICLCLACTSGIAHPRWQSVRRHRPSQLHFARLSCIQHDAPPALCDQFIAEFPPLGCRSLCNSPERPIPHSDSRPREMI